MNAAPASPDGPPPPGAARAALVERLLGRPPDREATDEERRDAAEQLHALGTAEALAGSRGSARRGRGPRHPARRALGRAGRRAGSAARRARAGGGHRRGRAAAAAPRGEPGVPPLGGSVGRRRDGRCPRRHDRRHRPPARARIGRDALGRRRARPRRRGRRRARRGRDRRRTRRRRGARALAARHRPHRRAERPAARWRGCSVTRWPARCSPACSGRTARPIGGALEGLVLGASAGLGYAMATTRIAGGGMATPHGGSRLAAAVLTGGCAAAACLALALADRHLVAASLDVVAEQLRRLVGRARAARAPPRRTGPPPDDPHAGQRVRGTALRRRPGVRPHPPPDAPRLTPRGGMPRPAGGRWFSGDRPRAPSAHLTPISGPSHHPLMSSRPGQRMLASGRANARPQTRSARGGMHDGSSTVGHRAHLRARHRGLGLPRRLARRPHGGVRREAVAGGRRALGRRAHAGRAGGVDRASEARDGEGGREGSRQGSWSPGR